VNRQVRILVAEEDSGFIDDRRFPEGFGKSLPYREGSSGEECLRRLKRREF